MEGLMVVQKQHFQPVWENKGICPSEELKSFGTEPGIFLGGTATFVFKWERGEVPMKSGRLLS